VITVILRGDPEGKGRPRSRMVFPRSKPPFIHVYSDPKTAAYEKTLALAGKVAMRGRPPLMGPLAITVTAIMRVPASWPIKDRDAALAGTIRPQVKPDWDNIGKTSDALNGIVWNDDVQIVFAQVLKVYGEEPMLKIEIREAPVGGGLL
jgi:Holliday junction resolvase RusA-like endonuclease